MVWGPIKKLLKRARAARQNSHDSLEGRQEPHLDPTLQEMGMLGPSTLGLENSSLNAPPFNDFGFLGQTPNQPLDFLTFAPDTFGGGIDLTGASKNLDNWNDFMFDVNALDRETVPDMYNM
jgi:hypothetical protein